MPNSYPKIKNPKMRTFFEKGADFIEKAKQAYAVDVGSPECVAWLDYFDRHIGERPYAVRLVLAKPEGQFTVPTQWPEWFDSSAAAWA